MNSKNFMSQTRRFSLFVSAFVMVLAFGNTASAEADPQFTLLKIMPTIRDDIGKDILPSALDIVSNWTLNPERIDLNGASFFSGGPKELGLTVDGLRAEFPIVVALTTCPGAPDLDHAKISGGVIWETISKDKQGMIALGLQQLLSAVNKPDSVQTPGSMRSPKIDTMHGVIFEYQKGDISEQVSFLNEDGTAPDNQQKIQWVIKNAAVCPK